MSKSSSGSAGFSSTTGLGGAGADFPAGATTAAAGAGAFPAFSISLNLYPDSRPIAAKFLKAF